MTQLVRSRIPQLIILVCGLIVITDLYFDAPVIVHNSVTTLQKMANVISAFAIGLGVMSVLMQHSRKINRREEGTWYFSAWLLFIFIALTFVGFYYGATSSQYSWFFNNVFVPVNQTMYSLLGVFIVYAFYRTFQARNYEVGIMLIVTLLTLMGSAPIGAILWSGFPVLKEWMKILNLGGYRGFIIVTGVGAVAMGVRVLMGKEKSAVGGTD